MKIIRGNFFEGVFVTLALSFYIGVFTRVFVTQTGTSIVNNENNAYGQAFFFVTYLVAIIFFAINSRAALQAVKAMPVVWLLTLWTLLSVIWSFASDVTLRRSIALIGTTLFAAYLVFRFSLQRLFQLMGIAFAFFVILSYSYSIYYPNTFMWTGVFFTKNELTRTSILAMLVFGYCLFATKKIIWGVFLLGAIGLIFKSNSATGNIIFFLILVLFFLFVLTRHLTKIRKADIFIIAGLLALLSAVLILVNPSHIFAFFQKDITLTGRVPLWILVWNAILQKPLLGYGYGGFWLGWEGPSAYIRSIIQWHPPHAHNGFLDIMLDLGATGLLLYLLFLLSLVRQFSINRQTTYLFRLFTILLTIFLIIYNTVENIALSRNSIVWILGVVVLLQNSIILKTGE